MFYRTRNALLWMSVSTLLALLTWVRFQCDIPVVTFLALLIPAVALLRGAVPADVGIHTPSSAPMFRVTAVNLVLLLGIMAFIEPLTQTYRSLISMASEGCFGDSTFAWLSELGGATGLAGMLVYGSGVVVFAQELFFRGWLLEKLRVRVPVRRAVGYQAVLFALCSLPVAFRLPWPLGAIYLLIYQGFGRGIIGGWAAVATHSIWPSLISSVTATVALTLAAL